ncbi:MAG: hypothetical protein COA42_15540 [Alteromonadaceae bacterium]|nr:MAG: hypothetical protein COA42_15540 [Alteromonadaceae bacterium]
MYIQALFIIMVFCLCIGDAKAEVYRWKDENGKVHYSDQPHPDKTAVSEKVVLEPVNIADAVKTNHRSRARSQNKKTVKPHNQIPTPKARSSGAADLASRCREAAKYYKKITIFNRHSEGYEVHVLVDDKGKELTRKKQDAIAEKFRAEANTKGCQIVQTNGLRLSK